jgi:phage terminase large subunit
MAKQRDPLRDEAKRLFDEANGDITNREIAVRLGTDEKKVAVWKQRDGWTVVQQRKIVQQKVKLQQKKTDKKVVKAAAENTTLTEQQITFCLLYTKTYNATQSYMRAYGVDYRTAHSYGYTQLQNPDILAEIKRLQAVKNQALLAGAQDVVELHMRIAFADITDFFDFKGLLVTLKNSDEVDGQLISEVKETDQGVSLKLADRQKSLDFLERYFMMNPLDVHKRDYDNARLELDRRKAQIEAAGAGSGAPIIPDAVWRELMNPAYAEHLTNDRQTQIYFGGSSSGKSFGILGQRTIRDMLRGERNYLILRKTARTIRNSCYNEITKCINRMDLAAQFTINKTDMVITHKASGRQILFAGLDDVEKVKSITPAVGVITDIMIEEATEAEYNDYKSLIKRLRGQCEVPKRMVLLFNPVTQDHWIYTEFFVGRFDDNTGVYYGTDLSILRTTYKHNRFLTQEDINRLESETDKYYYDVYTLGKWGVLGHLIYTNWEVRDLSDMLKTMHQFYNGQDFGFFPDPAAFIRVGLNRGKKEIYVFKERKGTHYTNDVLAKEIKPIVGREVVTCDNAEPKSIQELNDFGITAVPARKGPGSLEFGIKWLQRHKIIVDVSCTETAGELRKYKYREDRNGNVLPQPVDKDNHLLDGLRYALEDVMVATKVS